jgi:energy-coupling factor transporter ATP-binding protein EcfA2
MKGVYHDFMPEKIKEVLSSFFDKHPVIWGIVFVFFIIVFILIRIKPFKRMSKSASHKELKKNIENKEKKRKLFINYLERRYKQKLIQKTDERFSPPMEIKYTKEGINENYTLFLDVDAKSEAEIYEKLAVLLNKHRHLLIIGQPGSGKTVRLHEMAMGLLKNASENADIPVPVIFNLASWTDDYKNLEEWFTDYMVKNYNVPLDENITEFVRNGGVIPLLDGFDEIGFYLDDENKRNSQRGIFLDVLHAYRNFRNNPMFVICTRNTEYVNTEGNMPVNAQIELQDLEEKKVLKYLDDIISAPNSGVYSNSNDDVARKLITHINKCPVLLKVLCIPFYSNALFQVLNRRLDEVKIDFPSDEAEIKDFIVNLYIKRKTGRENEEDFGIWGGYLCWLARWIKKRKKISFNLTDFNAGCLSNPKLITAISAFFISSCEFFLLFYLFSRVPVLISLIIVTVICVIYSYIEGLKYEEKQDEKIAEEETKKKSEDVETIKKRNPKDNWMIWNNAFGFALISGVYFSLALGIVKGLICAAIVAIIYRFPITLIKAHSKSTDYNLKLFKLEKHSRGDELKKWHWNEFLRINFWTHVIHGMFINSITYSLFFALFVGIFGADWKTGFAAGTLLGLTVGFWSSIQRAYKIKYYDDKADKPIRRLLRGLFMDTVERGLSYFMAKYFICIYFGGDIYISLTSALVAGALGVLLAVLNSLFLKHLIISIILGTKRQIPFPMNLFFDDCVKANILEYENSSWKFRHQILIQYFIDNFAKPESIKNIEKYCNIQLKELEQGSIWEYRNTYKLNQRGDVIGLNISNNGIEEIIGINALTKLQELNLSGNNISKIQFWSFYDSTRLKRLEILDLSNNKISRISNLKTLTGIRILNLSNNHIEDISPIPYLFKRINYLFVKDNCISDIPNIDEYLKIKYLCYLSIDAYSPRIMLCLIRIRRRTDFYFFSLRLNVAEWLKNPFLKDEFVQRIEDYLVYFNKVNAQMVKNYYKKPPKTNN